MDNFDQLTELVSDHARDLLEEGVHADDVSGAFLSAAVAVLIASEGRQEAADYLTRLAMRVAAGGADGSH